MLGYREFRARRIIVVLVFYFQLRSAQGSAPCVPVFNEYKEPTSVCLPVEAVNEAFDEARRRHELWDPLPPSLNFEHHHEATDVLGQVITETSLILAKNFKLSRREILNTLPRIDTKLTRIWDFCPERFQDKNCLHKRYRTFSGHCNNIENPDFGATLAPFANILPPLRPDGINAPREESVYHGASLPSPRLVSSLMHRDSVVHDHSVTTMLIAWGQIIDHDITLTADTKDPLTLKEPQCCPGGDYDPRKKLHHNCYPIDVPATDPFYSHYGQQCLNFLRSYSGVRTNCTLGPRVAFNTISSYLDANFAYGSSDEFSKSLRAGVKGKLLSFPAFEKLGLKELLPLKLEDPDDGCIRHNKEAYCFLAGDNRVNEQLVLTVLHTIFLREHNRVAENLGEVNPHWDDELIFQETRKIVIATVQHITYNEFLPMVLGRHLMDKYGLELLAKGFWKGYDLKVNPTAAEEFITSAFRFGHSLLPSRIERWSLGHKFVDSEPLHKLLRQPYALFRPGFVDTFASGMVNQLAQAMDEGVTEEVTTLLFKEPQHHFGMDLAAMNIQRGREHGVQGYAAYRKACGLSPVHDWDELAGVMRNETVEKYRKIYASPQDIDLWSGGVSEIADDGSLVGPTFGCIIAQQFQALRYGDRFWYESSESPSPFTLAQLEEIRKIKLSRLLCDNSDNLKTVQLYAMVYPNHEFNPRIPCASLQSTGIDFEKWREAPVSVTQEYGTIPPVVTESTPRNHGYISLVDDDESTQPLVTNEEEDLLKSLHRIPPPPEETRSTNGNHEQSTQPSYRNDHQDTVPTIGSGSENEEVSPGDTRQTHRHPLKSPLTEHNDPAEDQIYTQQHLRYMKIQPSRPHGIIVHHARRNNWKPVIRHRSGQRKRKLPKPFPENHPFPGLDGLFSPNPGYLVRQRFVIG